MRAAHLLWIAALFACRPATPASEKPAMKESAPTTTPIGDRSTPWVIEYADGSANLYRFSQQAPGAEVLFVFEPVKPAESSTGQYSGGEPREARLAADDERVAELWRRIERLEVEPTLHADARGKGTGAFRITTPAGTRSFVIHRGLALEQTHDYMKRFRD